VKYARPVESPKGFPASREIPQGKHFTPVEHPEGARFNGACGASLRQRQKRKGQKGQKERPARRDLRLKAKSAE